MPIHCPLPIRPLSAEEFEALDYRVMRQAYDSQNELGRLCDERVYETDLAARLITAGFERVHTQVPVTVTHENFRKQYFLDLVADDTLYELKISAGFTGEDESQIIHYLLLLDLPRGKLLNFRPPKVQGRLQATSLTLRVRRQIDPETRRWKELSPQCGQLHATLLALLADWGAFLDFHLYQQALIHFLGGETQVARRLPLKRAGLVLGNQKFFLHAPGFAFHITALTDGIPHQEIHLRRLLALTELEAMQWINFNHATVQFTTLRRTDQAFEAKE